MHLGIFAGKLEYRKAVTDRYSIEIGLGDRFLMWDTGGAPNFFKRKGALNGVFTRIERKRLKSVSFSKAGSGAYVRTGSSESWLNANACRRLLRTDR